MKKNMRKILTIVILLLYVTACNNFNENAAVDHISRTWTVYKFEVNGYDQTPLFTATYGSYQLICERDRDYTESYVFLGDPKSITGIYIFSDGDDILTLSDEFQSRVYNVLTLTNNEMTLEDRNSDSNNVYYLEAVL